MGKNSSHAHWWLRFGVQSSAPLIGSDCTFLRLPPWGIWMSWKPSSPVKVIFPSQSESCGRLSARFEAGWSSFHCHLLLAWGTVLLEIEPGKNPGPLRCALVCLDHPMILVSLFIHRKKKRTTTIKTHYKRPFETTLNIIWMSEGQGYHSTFRLEELGWLHCHISNLYLFFD